MSAKVAAILADKIIKEMENGKIPWDAAYKDSTVPFNPLTDKDYHGFNRFVLMFASLDFGDNRFLGMKQGNSVGGTLKKGSKGIPIYCPMIKELKDSQTGERASKTIGFMYKLVFSVTDFEGITANRIKVRDIKRENNPIDAAESFISLRQPKIKAGPCPCYIPSLDEINMPDRNSYLSSEYYYSTLLHELGHWTGAESRMKRQGVLDSIRFGSEKYGKEELVAEMFSFLARNHLGLEAAPDNPERKNRVAYLQGWIEKLKAEPQILFSSANEAEKALNWYIGADSVSNVEGENQVEVA